MTVEGLLAMAVECVPGRPGAVIELPVGSDDAARLAMRRGALRYSARMLRRRKYKGAALELEMLAESMREVDDEWDHDTVAG